MLRHSCPHHEVCCILPLLSVLASGHGSERFVSDARRRSRDIAALVKYKHYDENNQDDAKEGKNMTIRHWMKKSMREQR